MISVFTLKGPALPVTNGLPWYDPSVVNLCEYFESSIWPKPFPSNLKESVILFILTYFTFYLILLKINTLFKINNKINSPMTTLFSIRSKTEENLFFILQFICSACSINEIKFQTGLSFQTASNHFRNLKNKIQKIIQNIFIYLSFFIISTKHPKFILKSNTTNSVRICSIPKREINLFIKVT